MRILVIISTFLFVNLIPHFVGAQCCNTKNVYWEQLSNNIKEETISSCTVNIDAVNYYKGTFRFTDDEQSLHLLDELTLNAENKYIMALYFYLFNDICIKSDGAVSEMLGKYCQKVILNDPVYVLNYFSSHNLVMTTYARLLSPELYFKEQGVSDIKIDFGDFKELVNKEITDAPILTKTFNDFNKEVEQVMKTMD